MLTPGLQVWHEGVASLPKRAQVCVCVAVLRVEAAASKVEDGEVVIPGCHREALIRLLVLCLHAREKTAASHMQALLLSARWAFRACNTTGTRLAFSS